VFLFCGVATSCPDFGPSLAKLAFHPATSALASNLASALASNLNLSSFTLSPRAPLNTILSLSLHARLSTHTLFLFIHFQPCTLKARAHIMSEERLLPTDAVVQNRKTRANFVFGTDNSSQRQPARSGSASSSSSAANTAKKRQTQHSHSQQQQQQQYPDDSIEMTDFQRNITSRKTHNPWKQASEDSSSLAAPTFILHEVESHHTLTGIALQYRTTVSQPLLFCVLACVCVFVGDCVYVCVSECVCVFDSPV